MKPFKYLDPIYLPSVFSVFRQVWYGKPQREKKMIQEYHEYLIFSACKELQHKMHHILVINTETAVTQLKEYSAFTETKHMEKVTTQAIRTPCSSNVWWVNPWAPSHFFSNVQNCRCSSFSFPGRALFIWFQLCWSVGPKGTEQKLNHIWTDEMG